MRIFSNSAMSLDGKLADRRGSHVALGSPEDRRLMSRLRARADAVLVGGETFRAWPIPLVEQEPDARHRRDRPILNAVLTRTGRGPRRGRFFQHPDTEVVFLTGPDGRTEGLPPEVTVHRAPAPPDVRWAVETLQRRHGIRSLLVEGGGELIFQFLEANLLDELFVTLCPMVIGGRDAPSLVDGEGFRLPDARRLELASARHLGAELFLRYRVSRPS